MTEIKKKLTGRKPVHLVAVGKKPGGRDAIWAEIRKQREFTYRSLTEATDIPKKTIGDYLKGLEAAGIVKSEQEAGTAESRTGNKKQVSGTLQFSLVKDCDVHAPRVRKDGSAVLQGRATESMWSAMRFLKQFTSRELAIHASTDEHPVSEVHANDYCKTLAKAKYLRVVKAGRPGRLAVYQFVRFTGPKAPMIQRIKQVFDPNTGEVVWSRNQEAGTAEGRTGKSRGRPS